MKGISPIVASVLLIAITMTIAGVLAYWSSTFVSTSLPTENITTAQCRLAQFEFLNCKYNSTSQNITFSLNNVRSVDLGNLTAFVEYPNGSTIETRLNQSLPGNTIRTYTVSSVTSDFSSILIKTICPDVFKSAACTR